MKIIKNKISKALIGTFLASIALMAISTTPAFATDQNLTIPEISTLPGPSISEQQSGTRNVLIERTLPRFIVTFVGYVAIAALLFLVVSGVRFATAYGNEEGIEKAKNQTIYAVAGFVIAILAYTSVSIIANLKLESDESTGSNSQAEANVGDDDTSPAE